MRTFSLDERLFKLPKNSNLGILGMTMLRSLPR
jgi:hypothetical protein